VAHIRNIIIIIINFIIIIIIEHAGLAVTLLTCTREMPGSNFGRGTCYIDRGSRGFPQFLQANAGIVPRLGLLPNPTQFIYHPAIQLCLVGFEVFTAVVMKSIIIWDMMPCSPLSFNRRFGGTYRLHLQGRRNRFSKPASKVAFLVC
jgi:hypothetical protein